MTDSVANGKSGKAPPRWVMKTVTHVHGLINQWSGARLGNTIGGDEVCFVTMKGARTGRSRVIPLMYVPHGNDVLLVASLGGAPRNPTWFYNVVANPDVTVRHRGVSRPYQARLASAEEKADLWPVCDAHYAPYADYRKRTARDIPIFVCEPAN